MKRFSVIGLLVLVLLLVCVWPGLRTESALRDRLVITAVGFHRTAEQYTVSVQGVEPLKTAASLSEQEEGATAVYSASAPSVPAALYGLTERASRRPFWRQNRLLILSEAFCRDMPLADGDSTDPRLAVAVCRGDPKELLGIVSGNDAIAADEIQRLLTVGARQGQCLYRTFLDLERTRAAMWDAVLPILGVREGRPYYDGTALFDDGRLVGTLTHSQTTALCLLLNEAKTATLTVNGTLCELSRPKRQLRIHRDGERFTYRLAFTAHITADKEQAEAVRAALQDTMTEVLRTLDTASCDALGLARLTATQYPSVTQKTVSSQLSSYEKTVTVDLTLH